MNMIFWTRRRLQNFGSHGECFAIAAVLGQLQGILTTAEQNYSIYDRQLLGIQCSIRHIQIVLEGVHFTVKTDDKPFTSVFSLKSNK